jgi:hypothetical protein
MQADSCGDSNKRCADKIAAYHMDINPSLPFSQEIATAIHELYRDPVIRQDLKLQFELFLEENNT